jgi:cysteinyl-tRNA synthetase
VVTSQYRTPLNFNKEGLEASKKALTRLDKLRAALEGLRGEAEGAGAAPDVQELASKALSNFEAGMADDLNTPRAAAALFTLVKGAEKALKQQQRQLSGPSAALLLDAMHRMDAVLGVFYEPAAGEEDPPTQQQVRLVAHTLLWSVTSGASHRRDLPVTGTHEAGGCASRGEGAGRAEGGCQGGQRLVRDTTRRVM